MKPLQTDEKLEVARPLERDMDGQMLFGCSGFVFTSFATYFLSVWPFFVWMDIHQAPALALACGAGLPFAFILGAVTSAHFEIAGAAGFIGGILATAIFVYLRFEQVFLEVEARRIPMPFYPPWIQWFAPIVLVVCALFISILVLALSGARKESAKKR
jgi:hypothetical protein